MSLARMTQLVTPPKTPVYSQDDGAWKAAQKRLKVTLPECLRQYGLVYGSGEFDDGNHALEIFNPLDPNYVATIQGYGEIYASYQEDTPEFYPFSCYPDSPGLIPMAAGNGAILFYLLQKSQGDDYDVVFDDRITGHNQFSMEFFEFFCSFFCNTLTEDYAYFHGPIAFIPGGLAPW